MTPEQLRALYDEQERRNARFAATERIETAHTIRTVDLTGGRSFLLYSDLRGLTDAAIDAVIDEEISYFTKRGGAFEWKVYRHDSPPDLADRLAAHSFVVEDWETLLICELADAPARLFDRRGHIVDRLVHPDQVDEVMAVLNAIWGPDDHGTSERLRRELIDTPDQISIYLARIAGQPVGAAWMSFTPNSDFASLWAGGVLPEYRGRGLYGALLAARAEDARARGRRFLMIDAGPMSRPIVENLGFRRISESNPCRYDPRSH